MDKESVINIANKYSETVCEAIPSVKEVILYGSYAKDKAKTNSDIDIAVIVKEIKDNYLNTQIQLFKLRRSIDLRIEPVLIGESNDKSGFLEEIRETGLIIYSEAVPY